VLHEWNDELNARLAVVGAYFGKDVRDFLDRVVYEAFMEAGQRIEDLYRQVTATDSAVRVDNHAVSRTNTDIGRLNHLAYQLGVTMVRVREERVVRAAPGALGESSLTATRL
jgi:hypothetical protein